MIGSSINPSPQAYAIAVCAGPIVMRMLFPPHVPMSDTGISRSFPPPDSHPTSNSSAATPYSSVSAVPVRLQFLFTVVPPAEFINTRLGGRLPCAKRPRRVVVCPRRLRCPASACSRGELLALEYTPPPAPGTRRLAREVQRVRSAPGGRRTPGDRRGPDASEGVHGSGHPGSPPPPRESESRNGSGPDVAGEDAALPITPRGGAQPPQPAHNWGLPGETKRRAPVNQRPAGSKWMRSGSPGRTRTYNPPVNSGMLHRNLPGRVATLLGGRPEAGKRGGGGSRQTRRWGPRDRCRNILPLVRTGVTPAWRTLTAVIAEPTRY